MRSNMTHTFSEVPQADIPRSIFERDHAFKTTFDADELYPILVDDVVPGDTFNVNASHFVRLGSPLLHPLMDNLRISTFFFFVPYRLLWENWERMHGAQDNPDDSIDFTIPKVSTAVVDITNDSDFARLANALGLPMGTNVDLSDFSALPFRAYNLIWTEHFRDQNLQDSLEVPQDNGPDTASYAMKKRGKRHDYFTSCLPWPQKGDAVTLPLGESATVAASALAGTLNVQVPGIDATGNIVNHFTLTGDPATYNQQTGAGQAGNRMFADLSTATAATINDLRLAFQTQRLLERDARGGTRYNEMILSHFGVTVPDYRVQRPEYLGGGRSRINYNEVPNTSGTATESQGELAAYGTGGGTHGFSKAFTEHGLVMGFACVDGDITYSQGAERYWFKETRYDFYYPVLSQIGEQAVENREIYYQNTADDLAVFGYQERYAEMRYKPSRVAGLFAPTHPQTLASWHLSEEFQTLPALGDTFIQSNTASPLDRALSVPSQPQIIADWFIQMRCARPMPLYGVPGNLDHF